MTTWSSPSSSGDTGDLAASFEPEQDHDDSQGHDSLMHDTPSEAHQEQAIATLLADTSIRQPPSAAVRHDNDDVGGANQDDTNAAAAHQQPQQFTPSPPPPTSMSPARPPHVAVPAAQTPHTPSTPHSAQISLEQLYVVDGFTPTPSAHAAAAEAPPRDHTPAAVAGRHAIHGYVRECARSVLKGTVEKQRVGMPPPSPNTNTKSPWRGPRYFMCISKTQTSPQNMLGAATPKTPTSPARWSARDARSPGLASLSAYGAVSSPNGAEGVGTSADVARAIRRFERDMLATKGDLAAERAQHDELRSQIKRMREALPAQRAALLERIAAVYGSATRGRMRCRACFAAWRRLAASEAATHAMVAAMRSLDGALVSKALARDVQAADAIQAIYNALAPLARRLQPMGAFVAWRHVVDTSRALLEQAPAGPAFAFRLLSRFERVAALAARSDARRLRAALRIFTRRAQQIGARRTALGQVAASIARRRPGSKPRVIFAAWRRYACPRAGADRAAKSRRRLLLLRSIHHWRRIALASAREHINLGGMRKGRENEVNVNSASDVLNKLRFFHAEAARTRGSLVSLKHEATVKMAALKEKCRRRQEVCQGLASNYERFKQRSRVFHAWRRETCSLPSAAGGGGRESMMSMLRHAFAPASISTGAATVVVADDDFVSASEKPRSPIATPNELHLLGDIGILRQQLRAAAAEKKRARTSPGPDFGKPPPRSTSNLTSSPTTRLTKPSVPGSPGIVTFCDAVERLLPKVASGDLALKKVTFLGRGAMVHGKFGVQYVQDRAREWGVPWKVISRYGPVEAKNYLREGGRLAVMPSRIENSPYTVYECCELGLPFVASDVGGVADLVHPEDHDGTLFTPDVDTLTSILERALKEGVRPARPRVSAQEAEDQYVSWTWKLAASVAKNVSTTAMDMARKNDDSPVPPASPLLEARALPSTGKDGSHPHVLDDISMPSIAPTSLQESKLPFVSVVMTHYQRPKLLQHAIEAVARQDYPADRYELILWDDGSKDEETKPTLDSLEPLFEERNWKIVRGPNVYLGAARNRAFEYMNNATELVIFTDDDNYLKPYAVRMFATAMNSSNADVLTSFVDFFWGEDKPTKGSNNDRPSYLFLGGSSDVGAFKNSFGDANCCIRRSSFVKIGGYTEDYGVGFEDWEMYANATLRNFKVDIVPDALYFYRFTKGSMQKTTNYFTNRRRSLRPYLDSLPSNLHHVILSAVFPRTGDNSGAGSPGKPTGLAAEGDSRFHGVAGPDGVAPAPPQAGVGSKRPQASTEGAGGGGRMAPLSPNGGGKGGSTQSLIGGRKKDEL
ncbi:hypothetical protein PPROV_000931600 [Pycnococcus provasolii]|uniref:Glycosyltransferase 2-like domain-containing protein n=1 Tax=Pycnococcus provasolii TaxID=41880 RepID=A0A830HV40_9CHLO|nr:hypothetical protein PPROV_000931600 [Pycnococcus provasolii]